MQFKFGDKVWHDENGLHIVICVSCFSDSVVYTLSDCDGNITDNYKGVGLTKVTDLIKCSERMPELGVSVLALEGTIFCVNEAYDFGDRIRFYDDYEGKTTHWMPLPDLPTEDA